MQLEKSVMHLQSCYFAKPIAFLPFLLFSPSSLLKLFIVVVQNFCYHGNGRHTSPLSQIYLLFFCRFRCRHRLALLSVSVIQGPFNLEKVLNFTSRLEKSESLNSVKVLKKYLMSLLGFEKSLNFTTLQTPSFFCKITRIILPRRIWLILGV